MTKVLHLIDSATPTDLLEQIPLLTGPGDEVVSVGPPPLEWARLRALAADADRQVPIAGARLGARAAARRVTAVHCPMGAAPLAGGRLSSLAAGADVIHAWSLSAASAGLCAETMHRLVVSTPCLPPERDLRKLAEWARDGGVVVTVPTEAARRGLVEAGGPDSCVRVLPPAAEATAQPATVRARIRAELGVRDDQVLLVAPGEMVRAAGHKYAPWVHAILRQIRPDLRLLVPGRGEAAEHVRFYVNSGGQEAEAFLTEGIYATPEAVSAADAALFFPERDCGVGALAAAMAAGLPIVASRTPDVAECTVGGEGAWLVPPGDPREGAAGVMRVLDDVDLARRISQAARRRAQEDFAPARCRERLAEVYSLACPGASSTAWQYRP
jgi:glycosyltransferase involved in cell wall biosynthesis